MPAKPSSAAAAPAPPRRARRRWPLLLLALLLVLGGAHTALWFLLAARLEEGLAQWALLRRAEGWQVTHGPATRSGWPLRVTLDLPEVGLRRDGLGWQAERVAVSLRPPELDRLHLAAAGRQFLLAQGQAVPMTAEGLTLALPLGARAVGVAGLPREAALRAERLRLDLAGGPLELGPVQLDLTSGAGSGPADPLAALRGVAGMVRLPPALAATPGLSVLGPSLDRVSLDLALSGPWPGLAGTPAARATRWRDGGGTLELRGLALGWGAARTQATGVLALDETLQPAGEAAVKLSGAGAVLEAAREAGLVGRREVSAAQMLLAMMQRVPPEGGPPQLEVPVILERRTLSLGGMSLARLPALHWPGAAP